MHRILFTIFASMIAIVFAALFEDECGLSLLDTPLTCVGDLVMGFNPSISNFKCPLLLSIVENGVTVNYGFYAFYPEGAGLKARGTTVRKPVDYTKFGLKTVFQLGNGYITTTSPPKVSPEYPIPPEYVGKEFTLLLSGPFNSSIYGVRRPEVTYKTLVGFKVISKYKCVDGRPTLVLLPAEGTTYNYPNPVMVLLMTTYSFSRL